MTEHDIEQFQKGLAEFLPILMRSELDRILEKRDILDKYFPPHSQIPSEESIEIAPQLQGDS